MAAVFDRIKGALYGVAVGDALGGPLEFMPREAVRRAYPEGLRGRRLMVESEARRNHRRYRYDAVRGKRNLGCGTLDIL